MIATEVSAGRTAATLAELPDPFAGAPELTDAEFDLLWIHGPSLSPAPDIAWMVQLSVKLDDDPRDVWERFVCQVGQRSSP